VLIFFDNTAGAHINAGGPTCIAQPAESIAAPPVKMPQPRQTRPYTAFFPQTLLTCGRYVKLLTFCIPKKFLTMKCFNIKFSIHFGLIGNEIFDSHQNRSQPKP